MANYKRGEGPQGKCLEEKREGRITRKRTEWNWNKGMERGGEGEWEETKGELGAITARLYDKSCFYYPLTVFTFWPKTPFPARSSRQHTYSYIYIYISTRPRRETTKDFLSVLKILWFCNKFNFLDRSAIIILFSRKKSVPYLLTIELFMVRQFNSFGVIYYYH